MCSMYVALHQSIPAELKMIVETLALKSRLAKLSESQASCSSLQLDPLHECTISPILFPLHSLGRIIIANPTWPQVPTL
jgi:hypothetical protein